jgi:hypothetical protein
VSIVKTKNRVGTATEDNDGYEGFLTPNDDGNYVVSGVGCINMYDLKYDSFDEAIKKNEANHNYVDLKKEVQDNRE